MKEIRNLSFLLAALLLLLPLSGCGEKAAALDDLKPTDELVLYLPQELEFYITNDYIVPYRDLYGAEVRVKMVVVPGDEDAYAERVVNDVLAGEGPDILFLNYLPNMDVEKAARNHSFYDLTDLLASDPDFSEDDYVNGVFDVMRIDGRLYTVPISYRAPVYLSDGEKLGGLDFRWDGIETTADFMEEMARLTPIAAQRYEAFRQMMESQNRFFELFRASGVRLLDYGTGTVLPDETAFCDFFRGYRAYFPYDYNASGEREGSNSRSEELMRGDMLFFSANHFHGNLIWDVNEMKEASHAPVFTTIPSQTGEAVGQIYTQFAVNAVSKNVRNAYNFIKLLLSEEVQTSTQFNVLMKDVPVCKNAIRNIVYGTSPAYPPNLFFTEEEKAALYEQFAGMGRFTVKPSDIVYDMMWDAMLPYLQDEKSCEDCIAELRNKLTFYLSE